MTIEQRLAEIIRAFCADALSSTVNLSATLADTASGQQALFPSPATTRRARPAETARALHQLVTELTTLATAATVTKRVTIRRPPAGTPQTSPLFDEPGTHGK